LRQQRCVRSVGLGVDRRFGRLLQLCGHGVDVPQRVQRLHDPSAHGGVVGGDAFDVAQILVGGADAEELGVEDDLGVRAELLGPVQRPRELRGPAGRACGGEGADAFDFALARPPVQHHLA